MKDYTAKSLLLLIDIVTIEVAVILAFVLRNALGDNLFSVIHTFPLSNYLTFYPLYLIPILIFAYEGLYTHRFDFWHESRLTSRSLLLSLLIILAYLALSKSIQEYSRIVILFSFILMVLLVPLIKNISKKTLYRFGLWQRRAIVYGNQKFFEDEIFGNAYLGYVRADKNTAKTVFIHSDKHSVETLQSQIKEEIQHRHEVIFVPLVNNFDLTHSEIYELSNTRTNLIVLKNRLKSRNRLLFKQLSDTLLFALVFPLLLPILAVIAYKIRKAEPNSSILFKQERMGKDEQTFVCYKFRTMAENGDTLLEQYLKEHPNEIENYEKYHKYKNDPRITDVGDFLRRTSLDELPQIFNVLKGEMSFIGPRPYMLNEKDKIGEDLSTILTVKPGITGLWQVSGRSDVDFEERVELDVWYIQNWNLWMDLVILLKTVKTVLLRNGAS